MKCEVQLLEDNIRYRILIINDEQYILDMEGSILKSVFPFLNWVLTSTVFKVEDAIIERLKTSSRKKVEGSWVMSLAGIGYFLGIMLAPLMEYFEVTMTPIINAGIIGIAFILVGSLYMSMSYLRKKKLENVISLGDLQKSELKISPSSKKQVYKLLSALLWSIGVNGLFFAVYIVSGNIMMLLITSFFFFGHLLTSRITVEEGYTTVRFKD